MTDAVLAAEQTHLAEARAALATMQRQTADWETAVAGDSVSTQYLKQALYRRMRSLELDPAVPLFFGRLDYARDLGAELDETCHIGRRHIAAQIGGDPLVTDWRAPISRAFYQARAGQTMGVRLRRRFGFSHGDLTAYEDERLDLGTGDASSMVEAEIERPRSGPMRDIVATIQPDQDDLVRTDLGVSLCIQGAPGTGKTAVGLHRAAFLLYAFREQLDRAGVLVVGPNDSFLRYIGDVLPALGEIDATQHTVESLLSTDTGLSIRASESTQRATLKGDARMATVIARAVWSHVRMPEQMLAVPLGHRTWRIPTQQLVAAVSALTERGVRYSAGRAMLAQRIAHEVLLRMEASGATTDDRVQDRVARSKPVKDLVNQVWPELKVQPLLLRLLNDADFLAGAADGVLSGEEQHLLIGDRPARSLRPTLADLALADEIADQLHRTPSLGHVIIDESQDLSAMQLRAVGRRASTGSVTVLGDLAQATTPWALTDWDATLDHLGKPGTPVSELVEGFRVPGSVIDYAARLLPSIAPTLRPPTSVRHNRGEVSFERVIDVMEASVTAATTALRAPGTVGVIAPDDLSDALRAHLVAAGLNVADVGDDGARLMLTPASVAKGLEFDAVLLVEPAAIVAAEPDRVTGLRRLYVCLTRAVSSLAVVHAEPLPPELGSQPSR